MILSHRIAVFLRAYSRPKSHSKKRRTFQKTWLWVKSPFSPSERDPIPTKIGSKMGGEFTYPKMGSQNGFDNHSHMNLQVGPLFAAEVFILRARRMKMS